VDVAWQVPKVTFRNPAGVSTGGYGDGNCADEALWAAAELFRTTGGAEYGKYFLAHYAEFSKSMRATEPGEGWADVANLGLWTYVLGGGKDAEAVAAIRRASLATADQIVERHQGQRLPRQPDLERLRLGLQRRGGELWRAASDGQRVPAQAGLCRGRAG